LQAVWHIWGEEKCVQGLVCEQAHCLVILSNLDTHIQFVSSY